MSLALKNQGITEILNPTTKPVTRAKTTTKATTTIPKVDNGSSSTSLNNNSTSTESDSSCEPFCGNLIFNRLHDFNPQ